MATTAVAKLQH